MIIQTTGTIVGAKYFQGEIDGKQFDSCKVFVLTGLDESNGTAKGQGVAEYNFGASANFHSYLKNQTFPFEAQMNMEMVTNGRKQTMRVVAIKPINVPKAV